MIDRAFVPKLASKCRLQHDRHAGQWMLLYPERGQILNESAVAIVERCDGTRTVGAICDELAHVHHATPQEVVEIERDVIELLEGLRVKGLLA